MEIAVVEITVVEIAVIANRCGGNSLSWQLPLAANRRQRQSTALAVP
jgi:hypothetical protein